MWIDRAKEAKKRLNMSAKSISIATDGKLSERDVIKLLAGDYKKPFVDDVIALGAALKLTPKELFEESNIVVETTTTAQETSNIRQENDRLAVEIEKLTARAESLEREISHLNALLAVKDELLTAKDKLLAAKDQLLAASRLDKSITFH